MRLRRRPGRAALPRPGRGTRWIAGLRARRPVWRPIRPLWPPSRRTVLIAAVSVVALLGAAGYLVLDSGLFRARDVVVRGASRVPAAQIRRAAAVPLTRPLARLDLAGIGARVVALPGVASVRVVRAWPHTVRLEVVERTPLMAVSTANGYALVDATGVAFATVATPPKALPIAALDRISPADPTTRAAVRVLSALPAALRRQTRLLTAATGDAVTLLLRDGRSIVWGSADRSQSKARVVAALLHKKGSVYDVSAPDIVTVDR